MKKIVVAKALVQNDKREVLIVRRSKTAPRRPLEWDFPGGFVDEDDTSYQHACEREIFEETGLRIEHNHLTILYAKSSINDLIGELSDVTWLYFGGDSKSTQVQLSYEHDAFEWVAPNKLLEYIKYDKQKQAIEYILESQQL